MKRPIIELDDPEKINQDEESLASMKMDPSEQEEKRYSTLKKFSDYTDYTSSLDNAILVLGKIHFKFHDKQVKQIS